MFRSQGRRTIDLDSTRPCALVKINPKPQTPNPKPSTLRSGEIEDFLQEIGEFGGFRDSGNGGFGLYCRTWSLGNTRK